MMRNFLPVLFSVLVIASCSDKVRVIPRQKMADIYADMFMADQWLSNHYECKDKADTCLFYEKVFNKYGYTFRDFDSSVTYYMNDPEKFAKILKQTEAMLKHKAAQVTIIRDRNILNAIPNTYIPKTFTPGLSQWEDDTLIFWPRTDPAKYRKSTPGYVRSKSKGNNQIKRK